MRTCPQAMQSNSARQLKWCDGSAALMRTHLRRKYKNVEPVHTGHQIFVNSGNGFSEC
jgi:hypothetical protein